MSAVTRAFAVFALLWVAAAPAHSQAQSSTFTSIGDRGCGTWVAHMPAPGQSKSMLRLATEHWVTGYMTGLASAVEIDLLESTDANSIFAWVDKYCRDNPLDSLGKAGTVLSQVLQMRAQRR